MTSLRRRVVWGTVIASTMALTLSCAAIYALVRWQMLAQFDEALHAQAYTLGALVENDREGSEGDFSGGELVAAEKGRLRICIRLLSGHQIAASPVPPPAPPLPDSSQDQLWTWTADDGTRWRASSIVTIIQPEEGQKPVTAPPRIRVVASRPLAMVEEQLARIRNLMILVTVATAAVLAGGLAVAAAGALAPLQRFANWISGIDDRSLATRMERAGLPAEIQPVAERLNHLLARLEEAFQRERSFGMAVAHELRTPIAGLRSAIEVCLRRERDRDGYRDVLDNSFAMVVDLQRMIESLLMIGRLDRGQVVDAPQPVDLAKTMIQAWTPLEERAAARRIRMRWEIDHAKPIVSDPQLLGMVMTNVLGNLVEYADADSDASVIYHETEHGWMLTVGNAASGIRPGQERLVFDRFWRGDESRSDTGVHCGLGLALCRTIVTHLGGVIGATVADGRFSIWMEFKAPA